MAKKDEDKKDPTLLKIQDMIEYAFPQIDKFPRPEKSYEGMATRLKGIMARMAENCMDTKKCYYAKSLLKQLDELDREIMHCKFWVKVAYQTKLFSFKNFEVINDYLEQIGKMTGSWMNTVRERQRRKKITARNNAICILGMDYCVCRFVGATGTMAPMLACST